MNLINIIKGKAKKLKSDLTALYYAYQDPEIPLLPKIIIVIALGYALSPIDLIPDFIPVLGYLDDLIILPLLIMLSIKLIPNDCLNCAREKAKNIPLKLKHRWCFAIVFIVIWIVIFTVIFNNYT